jgi:hypothetical protein
MARSSSESMVSVPMRPRKTQIGNWQVISLESKRKTETRTGTGR